MAALGGTFAGLQFSVYKLFHHITPKNPNALKLGILSTAAINAMAIIYPSKTHPDVILYAVASRDASRAAEHAGKYGFVKSYGSYQDLLNDPEVDVVYIPTPNGLHYEWASKALVAGKHVLLEKPFTSNAEEARALQEQFKNTKRVDKHGNKLALLEAFHWRFHPATGVFVELLQKYGADEGLISMSAHMKIPCPADGDIRWNFDLAGGSLMDCTYALSFTRVAVDAIRRANNPGILAEYALDVLDAVAKPWKNDAAVDASMTAKMAVVDTVTQHNEGSKISCEITTDMSGENNYRLLGVVPISRFWDLPSITVKFPKHEITYFNALVPHVYHKITVRDANNSVIESRQCYAGGPAWSGVSTTESDSSNSRSGGRKDWSTYRYQLEAFVKKVRGEEPPVWITPEDSVAQMEAIDAIYRASGLPVRKSSAYLSIRREQPDPS